MALTRSSMDKEKVEEGEDLEVKLNVQTKHLAVLGEGV